MPSSCYRSQLLNSIFTLTALGALAAALVFLAGLRLWSPKLLFIRESLVFSGAFVFFIIVNAVYFVAGAVFVALRRSQFALANGLISGLMKLALVAGFASMYSLLGVLLSWGIATATALLASLLIFLPQLVPYYRPSLSGFSRLDGTASRPLKPGISTAGTKLVAFSLTNYLGDALSSLPAWILPLMVVNILSPEAGAYFYIAWFMAGLLLAISSSVSASLFAEGSFMEEGLARDLRRSFKFLAVLLIPGIIVFILLGDKLLLVFGREYSVGGTHLLWLLFPACIPASLNLLYLSIARVEKNHKSIIAITGAIAGSTLVTSYVLLPLLGIMGIGVGWLAAQTVTALVVAPKLLKRLRQSSCPAS